MGFYPKPGQLFDLNSAKADPNLYAYVNGNPIGQTDPYGLQGIATSRPVSSQPEKQTALGRAILSEGGFKPGNKADEIFLDKWEGKEINTKYQGFRTTEVFVNQEQTKLWSGKADFAPEKTTIPPKLVTAIWAARAEAKQDGFEWGGAAAFAGANVEVFAPISLNGPGEVQPQLSLPGMLIFGTYGIYHVHPFDANGLNFSEVDITNFAKSPMPFAIVTDTTGQETAVLIKLSGAKKLEAGYNYKRDPSDLTGFAQARRAVDAIIGSRKWADMEQNERKTLLKRLTSPLDKTLCKAASNYDWSLYRGYFGGPLTLVIVGTATRPATTQSAATQPGMGE